MNIKKESLYIKAYQKSLYLRGSAANMAANVERRNVLSAVVEYIDATNKGFAPRSFCRERLLRAMDGAMSPDLWALIPAIPTAVLVAAVKVDGSINVPSIGRAMAAELAANETTAVAIAQAAQQAMIEARHQSQKAAKKAALAAKKAAKKAAIEYAANNTCGQI